MVCCFYCECGNKTEKVVRNYKHLARCSECKRLMKRDFIAEHCGTKHLPGLWPMKSDALGVDPGQIAEASAYAKKIGVPTDFTSEGQAILTSPKHRRDYAEAHGFFDKQGGYSDPQQGGSKRFM